MNGIVICAKCKTNLDKRAVPVACTICANYFHKGCATNFQKKNSEPGSDLVTVCCTSTMGPKSEVRGEVSLESIMEEIKGNAKSLKNIKTTLDANCLQMTSFQTQLDDFKETFGLWDQKINKLTTDQSKMEKEVKTISSTQKQLLEENIRLQAEVEDIKQRSRRHNVEIHGVPEDRDEDIINLVISIVSLLGLPITADHFRAVHRIPTYKREQDRPIIASFVSVIIRDKILSAIYQRKGAPLQMKMKAEGEEANAKIYLSTHLTPSNKLLFKKARDTKKLGIKYVWERFGVIYVRVHEDSRVIKIITDADIENAKKSIPLYKQ